jgi:XTP/dITP diphosphohydrolase
VKRLKLLVATTNPNKLREIRHILQFPVEGCALKIAETGKTFEANAIKKAKAVAKRYKQSAVADDSGLMVNALNGAPGVGSARYAAPPTPKNLCRKLIKAMRDKATRGAKFVSVIALVEPDGKVKTFKGIVRGRIVKEMRGDHGFGYDPVFVPCGYGKTFAEMSPKLKNRISHRARALAKLKMYYEKTSI